MEPVANVCLSGLPVSVRVKFLHLPSELLFKIYSDWLDPHRISHWDSAICSRQDRQQWLEYLKSRHTLPTVRLNGFKPIHTSYIAWLASRCVRAFGLELVKPNVNDTEFVPALESWLKHSGPIIESVLLEGCHDCVIHCIRENCTNLRKITLSEILSMDSYWDILHANYNLKELSISVRYDCNFCVQIPDDFVLSWVKKVSIDMRLFGSNLLFFDFISKFPSLECLVLFKYELFSFVVGQLDKHLLIETLPNLKDVYLR